MKLAKIDNPIPIKCIPENDLNTILVTEFSVWISGLLSLTDTTSMERLEIALPAIKQHCWSLGFVEIKKMFEMYADGLLKVKPIPNYFDRILVGKIVEAYKEQKPRTKPDTSSTEISEESKALYIQSGLMKCLNHFEKHQLILDGYGNFLYDVLYEDYLPKGKEYKKKIYKDAKLLLEIELQNKKAKSSQEFKTIKEGLDEINKSRSMKVIAKSKELVAMEFLRKLFKDQELMDKLLNQFKIKKR